MTHYKMLDRLPSVSVTSNRNELKVYEGNIVYLNNGDNFELRFFNPTQEKLGVEIMFNGTKKGDSYLVLNPGQDIILDRFLDEQRKMLFETYSINGNNQDAVEAIQQNGIITFNFYKEFFNSYSHQIPDVNVNINYNFPPKPIKYKKSLSRGVVGTSGHSGTKGMSGTSGGAYYSSTIGVNSTFTSSVSQNINSTTLGSGTGYMSFQKDYFFPTSSTATATIDTLGTLGMFTDLEETELETGRVEKGEISSQTLKTVNAQFATTAFHSVSYQILPHSAMNRTVNDVREYCGECGYRLRKQTWKFCPKCGEKIN